MADEKAQAQIPIYVSYSTLGTFLDWLRETKVTPSRIDRSLWSSKFSGAVGSQLMGGLRFLKLLDEDRPTQDLEALVRAAPDQRKALLLQVLRNAYGSALVDELPGMTPGMLKERLSKLGTTDATYDKAQSFFINAAKAVGLDIPQSIAKKARNRGATAKRRNGTKSASAAKMPPQGTQGAKHTPEVQNPSKDGTSTGGESRTIILANGVGAVTLRVEVNWLTLDPEQRTRLFRLIDTFNELEPKLPGGDASRPEATPQEVIR